MYELEGIDRPTIVVPYMRHGSDLSLSRSNFDRFKLKSDPCNDIILYFPRLQNRGLMNSLMKQCATSEPMNIMMKCGGE
jgi:hypothetical protein